jgi:putative heme-binding domain-containing protein
MKIKMQRFSNFVASFSLLLVFFTASIRADEAESLFNGHDLTGWKGLSEFWTVEDGCIVGESTKQRKVDPNTFLIWQGGSLADFEVTAAVRFFGNNSGIQYRSQVIDEGQFSLKGYQLDLHPIQNLFGMLYGEKYDDRGKIALRGQRVRVASDGTVTQLGKVGDDSKLVPTEWNQVRIIAVGNRLIHQINGVTTIDVLDEHPGAMSSGAIGLQLHKGAPMRVEFKDIRLRRLSGAAGTDLIESVTTGKMPSSPPPTAGKAEVKRDNGMRDRLTDLESLHISPGFKVESVYSVPKDTEGSWVSMTIDDQGRLIASDQGKLGFFRVEIDKQGKAKATKMPVKLSGAQGLLWKSGCLYASITGEGLYRVTDTDGDDLLDHAELLSTYFGKGEHGNHALVDTEDSNQIFAVSGNQTPLPPSESIVRRRNPSTEEDLLLPRQWDPRGHAAGVLAPGGWVTRFDPASKTHDLYCTGFRNEYDVALNVHGDLFTFDADMEWDLGLPWYRPTRICHVVSGGDFGWRSGSGKWKEYYEDSLPPLVNIGPGSPTGVISGRGTKFPARYQHAIYALDWTFGRILAIHIEPEGASYRAEVEDFISGPALPVTDAVIGKDGALYFTTGGRGTKSELLRVVYTGAESTEPALPLELPPAAKTRRMLESFHGQVTANAVEAAWPHLSSDDRFLRHAARIAIESQPVKEWAECVFDEPHPQARISAAVALARMGDIKHRAALMKSLNKLPIDELSDSQKLGLLRAYALVCERLGKLTESERLDLIERVEPLATDNDRYVSLETLRLLVFLGAPKSAELGMQMLASHEKSAPVSWSGVEELNSFYGSTLRQISKNPPPTHAIEIAFILRNVRGGWTGELRRAYFEFLNAAAKASGGASYPGYLTNTRDEALATCSDEERISLKDITGESFNPVPDFPIEPPVGPGQAWTLDTALDATESLDAKRLSFERGRSLFHAVQCGACHRFAGLGGGVGPDLTSVPNKFTKQYLVEAIINPSKDISDQYESSSVLLASGQVLTGLVIEQADGSILVYSSDPTIKPQQIGQDEIEEIRASKISQMPSELLNPLNADELRDLVAYILSGGDAEHKTYRK